MNLIWLALGDFLSQGYVADAHLAIAVIAGAGALFDFIKEVNKPKKGRRW